MSTFVSLFQTKTQMNDLMDGLIQDMSTGIYTTKRPYPVQRCVLAQSYNSNVSWNLPNILFCSAPLSQHPCYCLLLHDVSQSLKPCSQTFSYVQTDATTPNNDIVMAVIWRRISLFLKLSGRPVSADQIKPLSSFTACL